MDGSPDDSKMRLRKTFSVAKISRSPNRKCPDVGEPGIYRAMYVVQDSSDYSRSLNYSTPPSYSAEYTEPSINFAPDPALLGLRSPIYGRLHCRLDAVSVAQIPQTLLRHPFRLSGVVRYAFKCPGHPRSGVKTMAGKKKMMNARKNPAIEPGSLDALKL